MVRDPVKRLGTEVERRERHLRPPRGVIEAALDIGIEGILTRMTTGPVPDRWTWFGLDFSEPWSVLTIPGAP